MHFERGPSEPPPGTDLTAEDVSDVTLLDAAARGDVFAFLALFDRTAAAVRAALVGLPPGDEGQDEVLAASYLEVWWLAGCRIPDDGGVTDWIIGIARRRAADFHGVAPPGGELQRPSRAQVEFAVLFGRPVAGGRAVQ